MSRACHMIRACMNEGELCDSCSRNLAFTDYFKAYDPTCHFGYEDCIHDPAYIFCYHKEWYHELYGDMTLEEAANDKEGCLLCRHGEHYDDEDK